MEEPALRRELGAFLRAHRERLAPADAGLAATGRRRTPGLRREEVAALSGVGLAWYTWLEQGRVTTSRQVLDAVSRVLQLDPAGHRHVLALAGFRPDAGTGNHESDHLRKMIETWPLTPALVVDERFDIVAWNSAHGAVWPDPGAVAPQHRNLLLLLVGDAVTHHVLPQWQDLAYDVFRTFRAHTDRNPHDERASELFALLQQKHPELNHWWQCRAVHEFTPTAVTVWPAAGVELALSVSLLRPVGSGAATVLVQTPADEPSRQRMTELLAGAVFTT